MKKIFFGIITVSVLITIPFLANGATFKTGPNYYLNPSAVIDDNLYAAGADVSITGTVNGDLMVSGGTITVSGPVNGDVAAAGGTINISGKVLGDARVAGGNIIIINSTGGELVIAGGQISILPGSFVGQDAKIFGGNISFSGEIIEKLVIKGETVYVNGTVGGDLSVEAREIKLGPNASVKGDFDYSAVTEATLEEGATISGIVNFKKIDLSPKGTDAKKTVVGFIGMAWIIKSLMLFVATLILFYLCGNQIKSIVTESVSGFWKEVLRGFIIIVVIPVAIILSFVTVVGVPIGLIMLFSYIAVIIISAVVSVLVFAKLALKYVFKKQSQELNWWIIIISVLVFGLITIIPFVGWIFTLIIFLSALGSTTNYIYKKLKG